MKEVLKYVCEHCKREYKVKANAEKHENNCWKDIKKKTCLTCIFFDGFEFADDGSGFGRETYIVCKQYADLTDGDKPIINCEYWVQDKRTKKEKKDERLKDIVDKLNKTGLTF